MKSSSKQTAIKYRTPTSTHVGRSEVGGNHSPSTSTSDNPKRVHGKVGARSSVRSDHRDDIAATSAVHAPTPTLTDVKIDKLVVALYTDVVSEDDASAISARLRRLVRQSKKIDGRKTFSRGSTKGDIFKRVVIQRLPSGAVVKYATEPSGANVQQRLQVTLNPGHIEAPDIPRLRKALTEILGVGWQSMIRRARCTRVDACIDGVNVDIDRLLVTFSGARSQGTFYAHADRSGRVGTYYLGSAQSATHGVAYDQTASEAYKRLVGEKLLARERVADDAEVVLKAEQARTRFEVRNVLKPELPLADLERMPTALDKFRIYELSERAEAKLDAGDLALLDVLRLRGETGARAWLLSHRNGRPALDRLEGILVRHAAPWWDSERLAKQLLTALQASDVWALLTK